MIRMRNFRPMVTLLLIPALLSACATPQQKSEEEVAAEKEKTNELRAMVAKLGTKLDALEGQITTLNDKVETTKNSVNNLLPAKAVQGNAIPVHGAEAAGIPVEARKSEADPEGAFVSDAAVGGYRKAIILFEAKKYPEAILAFTHFLDRYADHALAGSAQYYIGESYFKQKEYKLAVQEYNRVITSYDRSPRVSETLKALSETEDLLKRAAESTRHRQTLLALFPNSPAAKSLMNTADLKAAKEDAEDSGDEEEAEGAGKSAKPDSKGDAGKVDPVPTAPAPGASPGAGK